MTDRRQHRLCICDVFIHGVPDEDKPCQADPTQEDLLCNPCRLYQQQVRDMHDGLRQDAGVHASGIGGNGKHAQFGLGHPPDMEVWGIQATESHLRGRA